MEEWILEEKVNKETRLFAEETFPICHQLHKDQELRGKVANEEGDDGCGHVYVDSGPPW